MTMLISYYCATENVHDSFSNTKKEVKNKKSVNFKEKYNKESLIRKALHLLILTVIESDLQASQCIASISPRTRRLQRAKTQEPITPQSFTIYHITSSLKG